MGLRDRIKSKKLAMGGEGTAETAGAEVRLPEGEKLTAGSEEEFYTLCKGLTKTFCGVMLLSGKVDNNTYTAGLLIKDGNIVGASFENVDSGSVIFKDPALNETKIKLAGSKGDLELYAFSEEDIAEALKTNEQVLLKKPVRLSSIGIKIKGRFLEWANKYKGFEPEKRADLWKFVDAFKEAGLKDDEELNDKKRQELEELSKKRRKFDLVNFARDFSKTPMSLRKLERLRDLKYMQIEKLERKLAEAHKSGDASAEKTLRLEILKQKREAQTGALAEKLSKLGKQVSGGKGSSGTKMSRLEEIRAAKKSKDKSPGAKGKDEPEKQQFKEGVKIKTGIDELYKLVQQYGQLKINQALVHRLRVQRTQIEEWAMILEEHNLLELHYPAIGEPIIKKIHKAGS